MTGIQLYKLQICFLNLCGIQDLIETERLQTEMETNPAQQALA